MRQSLRLLSALSVVVASGILVGCGGDGGSDPPTDPDPTMTVTVDQFKSGFADETGFELTSKPFPGGAQTLSFDDDGDLMTFNDAEADFFDEFGAAQIYLVEADGDPDMIFDVVVGEPGEGEPITSGGDTVRLDRTVSEDPDADGIIWSKQCVVYEKDKTLNSCAWSGNKRYGQNVIVSWMATREGLDEAASRLDETVSAVVAGA